jgi:UMF1 family MFS transporter
MVKALVTSDPATDLPLYIEQNQTAMGATGLFFLVAALPTFLLVKNRTLPKAGFEEARLGQLFSEGFTQLKSTIANAKEHATFFKFLRAFLFYYAGMSACISFAGIFAKVELKLDTGELVMFFLVIQLCSAIGAMLFGLVDTRFGPRFTVLTTIYLWIFGSLLMAGLDPIAEFLETSPKTVFQFTGFILGLGVGSMQSSSRAVVGLLAPAEKSAEMFGFWGTFARLATLLGLAFGPLADFLGSLQLACLLLVVFFAIGAFLLSRLDLDGAIQR